MFGTRWPKFGSSVSLPDGEVGDAVAEDCNGDGETVWDAAESVLTGVEGEASGEVEARAGLANVPAFP